MKFNVTIERDEDGMWIAECPPIPGLRQSRKDQRAGA